MKKSVVYILSLLISFLLLDRIGGYGMAYCYWHTKAKAEVKIQHLVHQASEDIILLGNSRCAYHYVPSIICDSLHMSVYNGGIDGAGNIYSQYMMVCHLLAHHTPKVLCIETGGYDFFLEYDAFQKSSYFAPLFGLNAQADSIFREADTYGLYCTSSLYRYNAKSIEILGGMLKNHIENNDNGYFLLSGKRQDNLQLEEDHYSDTIDFNKIDYAKRIVRMCKDRNIILVWVISPAYRTINKSTFEPIKLFAEENGTILLDYHSEGLFLDHPDYFKDNGHLLDNGAREYSSIFAHDLKKVCKEVK